MSSHGATQKPLEKLLRPAKNRTYNTAALPEDAPAHHTHRRPSPLTARGAKQRRCHATGDAASAASSVRPERRASLPSFFPIPYPCLRPRLCSTPRAPPPLAPAAAATETPQAPKKKRRKFFAIAGCPLPLRHSSVHAPPIARCQMGREHTAQRTEKGAAHTGPPSPRSPRSPTPLHGRPFARCPLHSPTAPTRTPVASITGCPLRVAPGVVSSSARHEDFSRPFPSLDGNRYAICIIYTIAGGKPVYIRQPRPFAPLFVALLRPSHAAHRHAPYYFYPREHLVDKGARSGIPFFHSPTSRHQKVEERVSAKEITGITASTVYIHTVLR